MRNKQLSNEEYLDQIEILSRRITYHREQLLRLRLEAESVSSRWRDITGVSGGNRSGDASYVRMLERIEEKEEILKQEEELLYRLKDQAEQAIELLPKEEHRLVLLYRYLEGKNYVQTMGLMHASQSSVMHWKLEAVELLSLPEDPINIYQ